jgi:apolipoprotein N-acyltransferase
VVVGLVCAWRAWRTRADSDARVSVYETNAALCALALVGTCLAFEPLGFVATTALFLSFLFWLLGALKIWQAALGGAAASGTMWAIFSYLLGVGLPAGILGG